MKMEKISDYANEFAVPLPTDIGREFVRQYYTKWSVNPNEVFQFYGNESYFLRDEIDAKGQEAIQKAIEKLNFTDCKARIHSVTGVYGLNDSLVLQVCGELSVNGKPLRSFFQSFVLCQQTVKKYYVQTDIFQWLDKSFSKYLDNNIDSVASNTLIKANETPYSKSEIFDKSNASSITAVSNSHENGHSLASHASIIEENLNSHPISQTIPDKIDEDTNSNISHEVSLQRPVETIANNDITKAPYFTQSMSPNKTLVSQSAAVVSNPTPSQQQQLTKRAAREEVQQQQYPKTWAKAVSNSTSNNTSITSVVTQPPVALVQPVSQLNNENTDKQLSIEQSEQSDENFQNKHLQQYKDRRGNSYQRQNYQPRDGYPRNQRDGAYHHRDGANFHQRDSNYQQSRNNDSNGDGQNFFKNPRQTNFSGNGFRNNNFNSGGRNAASTASGPGGGGTRPNNGPQPNRGEYRPKNNYNNFEQKKS